MTNQPDPLNQSDPARELLPDRALAALNVIVGWMILLIVFAVSALALLALSSGGGGGMAGVAVGGAFAFVFGALFFSLCILAPLGWLLCRTGSKLWQGDPQARKPAETAAWIFAMLATFLVLYAVFKFG